MGDPQMWFKNAVKQKLYIAFIAFTSTWKKYFFLAFFEGFPKVAIIINNSFSSSSSSPSPLTKIAQKELGYDFETLHVILSNQKNKIGTFKN